MKSAPVIVKTWGAQHEGVRLELYAPRNRRIAARLELLEESAEMLAEIVCRAARIDDEEAQKVRSAEQSSAAQRLSIEPLNKKESTVD